jgi:hypothetical protein
VFPEILCKAIVGMANTMMNNFTTVMKQQCTINCFQTNPQILKKTPNKVGIKTDKKEQLCCC